MSKPENHTTNTLIIGASAAGLSCATCLKEKGIPHLVLERAEQVASSWRNHYDRLHLHTPKSISKLPGYPWPAAAPTFPSRDEVVRYMERYTKSMGIEVHYGKTVTGLRHEEHEWEVTTADGDKFSSAQVIVATGLNRKPYRPSWPGKKEYRGKILHSSDYMNGEPFRNERVLVVGFGNSAAEIALCLHEHGARSALSVRSPVNIVKREVFGIPSVRIAMAMEWLPPRVADMVSKPLRKLMAPDLTKYGLQQASYGPTQQTVEKMMVPVLDVGTMDLIEAGEIRVYKGVQRFHEAGVEFTDGTSREFDAVILGTGYRPALEDFLSPELMKDCCDQGGKPSFSGAKSNGTGLYFCGFVVRAGGTLRAIRKEARAIARAIDKF